VSQRIKHLTADGVKGVKFITYITLAVRAIEGCRACVLLRAHLHSHCY
jgi:hypothetical protein